MAYLRRQHHSRTDLASRQALPRWVLVDYYMLVDYMIIDIMERSFGRRAVQVGK